MFSGRRHLLLLLCTLIAFSLPSFAQGSAAALSGLVTDPTGLPIVAAKVEATNTGTGITYRAETTEAGLYNIRSLPPATYKIVVTKEGFERVVKTDVQLHVAEVVAINFSLPVGSVAETVTVTGGAPLVNTLTSALGGLVEEVQLSSLPLPGRNYIGLTLIQPGVVSVPNRAQGKGGYAGSWFSSNGASLRSNNFTLDGAILQDMHNAANASFSGTTLGLDAIAEYRVLTNSFSAEYGLVMGSQSVMVSKGGTNKFHGSVFEYLRNDVLDAANYFDRPTAERRLPPFRRNNFGASVGGAIVKDKTFFYVTYEGLRERKGLTQVTNTLGQGCIGPAGATITNIACPQLGSTASVTVHPVIAPILAQFPAPNRPNDTLAFEYSQPTRVDYGQVRIDHNFSDKDKLFTRYTIDDNEAIGLMPFPQFTAPTISRNQYLTIGEDHTFSTIALNTFRLSVSRTAKFREAPDGGLIGPQYSFMPGQSLSQIKIGGITTFGPVKGATRQIQTLFTLIDDFMYSRGRHSLKFGTQINRFRQDMQTFSGLTGDISFANVANFIRGRPNNYTAVTSLGVPPGRTYNFYTLGFYAQDDWRLNSRFTLNAGLRYEFHTNVEEAHGIMSYLLDPHKDAAWIVGNKLFENPSLRNFSPRLGFAWDVKGDGKTAVRGGAAIFYDLANKASAINTLSNNLPPFTGSSRVAGAAAVLTIPLYFPPEALGKGNNETFQYKLKQPKLYTWNLTVERQFPFSMALSASYAGSRGLYLYGTYEGNPNVPQTLADGQLFWPANTTPVNPNWGNIVLLGASSDSNYHSLQVRLQKRMTRGLQFQNSFTWSKNIDNVACPGTGDSVTSPCYQANPYNPRYDRGLSSLHLSRIFVSNVVYQLPSVKVDNAFLSTLASGWGISGIFTAQSGAPFTPVIATLRSRSGVAGGDTGNAGGIDRPNVNAAFTGPVILGGPAKYFDPNAFVLQPAGMLGNSGRNVLIGPGLANLDFAIRKDTGLKLLGEAGNLEFRVETFNLLNHPNFAPPNNVVFAGALANPTETPLATAGQITRTATESRQMQISLRISW
ncbi:MAG: TonB-dependent receptor domain-containing protein [Terriglobales bacterium]